MVTTRKEKLTSSSALFALPNTDSMPKRNVEVTVYDKHIDTVQVFRCDLGLLQATMVYFAPIIRRYLDEEQRKHGKCSLPSVKAQGHTAQDSTQALPPVPLRVNCDIKIFAWLMDYVEGRQRVITPDNAVSIALSSNFLFMKPLVEASLRYIKDHLVKVMLSGVNMSSLTGDLIARLSSMVNDGDLARAFLNLFYLHPEDSPNRRFLTALLRQVVCDRLLERSNASLRWCDLCGVLFDCQDLQRAERNGHNVKPALCPKLSPNCIGTRGEILKTHVPSSHCVDLALPSISWSDERVECWAWRVIGATYYYQCLRCDHVVFLVDAATHGCPGGVSSLVSLDNISRADAETILAWYETAKNLYGGGIEPMRLHEAGARRKCVLRLSPSGEWTCEESAGGGSGEIPGLWSSCPSAVEGSVDSTGRVSLDAQNGFERWLMAELQETVTGLTRPASPLNRPISPACLQNMGRSSRQQSQRKEKPFCGSAMHRGRAARFCSEQVRPRTASPMAPPSQSISFSNYTPNLSMSNLLSLGAELKRRNAATVQQPQ